jgi:DNA-binding transcriptional MerR regulator
VKMAELSTRSGVPGPTIRFYIREGLVPPGELTSPNQASYTEGHVRRLRLVRTLVEVGGLALPTVREVLGHMDAEEADTFVTLGKVQYAITPRRTPDDESRARVDVLLEARGWRVRPNSPARAALAAALSDLEAMGQQGVLDMLDRYAEAAGSLAETEVAALLEAETIEAAAEGVVAYDVLGDAVLSALRRLAQEHHTAVRTREP